MKSKRLISLILSLMMLLSLLPVAVFADEATHDEEIIDVSFEEIVEETEENEAVPEQEEPVIDEEVIENEETVEGEQPAEDGETIEDEVLTEDEIPEEPEIEENENTTDATSSATGPINPDVDTVSSATVSSTDVYSTNITVKTATTAVVWSLPNGTYPSASSKKVETVGAGKTYTVTKIYKTTYTSGDYYYWYKIDNGYIWAGHTQRIEYITSDITISDVRLPSSLSTGEKFTVKGKIASTNRNITSVTGEIINVSTNKTAVTVTASGLSVKSYSIEGSKIDTGLTYGKLASGTYNTVIKVKVADYSTNGYTLTSVSVEKTLTQKQFTVSHTHSYGAWKSVDANTHKRTCSCGAAETANHSWNTGSVTTQPTCTAAGTKTYTCTVCSGTKTESIPALGHTYGSWQYADANTHKRTCSCGAAETANHSWNAGTVTSQPTCTAAGTKTYTCTVCSGTKTENIAVVGHSLNHVAAAAATVNAAGNVEYWKCTVCGKYFLDDSCTRETTAAAVIIPQLTSDPTPTPTHAAPVLQTPANHENFMIIQWSKCEGATGYRVQYREGTGAWSEVYVPLTSVNSRGEPRWDYKNATDGGTYTFRVFADFADGTSTESNRMGQMRLKSPAITVKHFGRSDETGGFRIDWTPTTGGSQYKIYYREKGGSWSLYTMIPKTANTLFCNIKAAVTNANPNTPNLIAGHTYEFMVLTCTSVSTVTSGFPISFISMVF